MVSFMDLRKCLKYKMACRVSRVRDLGNQCIILAYLVVCHESKEKREMMMLGVKVSERITPDMKSYSGLFDFT